MAAIGISKEGGPTRGQTLDDSKRSTASSKSTTSGKSSKTCFLLSALTIGQVMLLSLFLLWTIKTCFKRYRQIYIVYPVLDPRQQSITLSYPPLEAYPILFNKTKGRNNNFMDRLGQISNNGSVSQMELSSSKPAKFTIVGSSGSETLALTLNWFESLRRLGSNYGGTIVVEDDVTYDVLSKNVMGEMWHFKKLPDVSELDVVEKMIGSGVDVLRVGTDSVWLKDPLEPIRNKYTECDLWITRGQNESISSSFVFFKSSLKMLSLVKSLKERMNVNLRTFVKISSHVNYLNNIFSKVLVSDVSSLKLNVCHLPEEQFPPEHLALETEEWFSAHKHEICVVRTAVITDFEKKRALLLKKSLVVSSWEIEG